MRAAECGMSNEYRCSRTMFPRSALGLPSPFPDYRVRFARQAGRQGKLREGRGNLRMPIHYEPDDEHIVRITIDRPEARNSADMEHFKQLRESWERFDADPDAWVAVITGVGDAFFTGADLKTYVPEITKVAERIQNEGLTEVDGYRLDDGTKSVLRGAKIWKPIIAA